MEEAWARVSQQGSQSPLVALSWMESEETEELRYQVNGVKCAGHKVLLMLVLGWVGDEVQYAVLAAHPFLHGEEFVQYVVLDVELLILTNTRTCHFKPSRFFPRMSYATHFCFGKKRDKFEAYINTCPTKLNPDWFPIDKGIIPMIAYPMQKWHLHCMIERSNLLTNPHTKFLF